MIRNIELKRFGRFDDASFELKQTTVFFGANEAGKTTLYDAFFSALCRPRASQLDGKRIRGRYGESASAEVEWASGNEPLLASASGKARRSNGAIFEEDEFANVNSIRAGSLHLDLNARKPWFERLMHSLFSGNMDPAVIIKQLDKIASERKQSAFNKGLRALHKERDQLIVNWNSGVIEQERLTRELERLDKSRGRVDELAATSEELSQKRTQLEAELVRLEARLEYRHLERRLELVAEMKRLEKQLATAEFTDETLKEYDLLESAVQDFEQKQLQLSQECAHRQSEREKLKEEEQTVVARLEDVETRSPLYKRWLEKAAPARSATRIARSWKPTWLVVSGLLLVCGFTGPFLPISGSLKVLVLGLGAAFAVAALAFARGTRIEQDEMGQEAIAREIWAEWAWHEPSATGERSAPSLDLIEAELQRRLALIDQLGSISAELARKRKALEVEMDAKERNLARLAKDATTAREQTNAWLKHRACSSRDKLVEAIQRHEQARERLVELQQTLAEESDGKSPEVVQEHWHRRLAELDEMGIKPADAETERTLKQTRRARNDATEQWQNLMEELRHSDRDHSTESGVVRASLNALLKQNADLQNEIHRLEARIADAELEKRAASEAQSIFEQIRDDSSWKLAALVETVQTYLERILPEREGLQLRESMLRLENLLVPDAGGTAREYEALSTGTQQAVILAFRLALFAKLNADDRPAILVLDEPFGALDRDREALCLDLLADFQQAEKCQLIFLTKDQALVDRIQNRFGGETIRVHTLLSDVAQPISM